MCNPLNMFLNVCIYGISASTTTLNLYQISLFPFLKKEGTFTPSHLLSMKKRKSIGTAYLSAEGAGSHVYRPGELH